MTTLEFKRKKQMTTLELQIVQTFKGADYYNGYPCKHPKDISQESGIPMRILRGVLASLVKKRALELLEDCNGSFVLLSGYDESQT